jgi:hypothetical protein
MLQRLQTFLVALGTSAGITNLTEYLVLVNPFFLFGKRLGSFSSSPQNGPAAEPMQFFTYPVRAPQKEQRRRLSPLYKATATPGGTDLPKKNVPFRRPTKAP